MRKVAILVDGWFYRRRVKNVWGEKDPDLFEHIDGLHSCFPKLNKGNK